MRKDGLATGHHPRQSPDPGIFCRIFQHCEIGHFSMIWLISLEKNCSDRHESFVRNVFLGEELSVMLCK